VQARGLPDVVNHTDSGYCTNPAAGTL